MSHMINDIQERLWCYLSQAPYLQGILESFQAKGEEERRVFLERCMLSLNAASSFRTFVAYLCWLTDIFGHTVPSGSGQNSASTIWIQNEIFGINSFF